MNARMRRIASDYEQIKKNFSNHKNIVVEPIGEEPAEKYRVTYYVNGIYLLEDGRIETLGKHIVIITLHAEYPRYKPICTIATPIWHPNFRDGQICIGDIWGAGESLCDIIVNIGDMIQYKSWNSFSPLSADAAEWAIANKHLFPVGNVNLWTGEEENGTAKKDFDIDLFDEGEETTATDTASEVAEPTPVVTETPIASTESVVEQATVATAVLEKDDENDFDITAEELVGIEFVPTAVRMQGSQYGATAKGGKVNFKTVFMKGILYGLIGGVLAWLLQEFIFNVDSLTIFSDWLGKTLYTASESDIALAVRLSSAITFCGVGLAIGAIMGLGEGIYYGSKSNSAKYAGIGAGLGIGLGFLSGFVAQIIYSALLADTTEYTSEIYLAVVRALGWAILGGGIGVSIGLIKPEKMRILNCSLGGLAGGFVGGFLFNFISASVTVSENDSGMIPRLVGIILMGALIGLGIGLLEQFAKAAWLKVIRGEFEGKEYLVFEGKTSIGNSGKNTIVLFKDKLVAPNHCEIIQEGNKYVLVDKGSPMGTVVNGMRITRHVLKQGDAIAIGNSVLVFNTK
ncbi:MAG: FHA domain-containing protein [Clostridia bacterium]|nr:FHA domain-containing protein [Clostridia bacterium]